MKRKVGIYTLGDHACHVFVNDSSDGDATLVPSTGSVHMNIGIDKSWREVTGCLIHEAFETCMSVMGCSYEKVWRSGTDVSARHFLMAHEEFNECSYRVGAFLCQCHLDLRKQYYAYQKDLRAKEREAAKKKKAKN